MKKNNSEVNTAKAQKASLRSINKRLGKEEVLGTAFAVIPLIGFAIFTLIPAIQTLYISFMDMQGFQMDSAQWNNFANFKTVFTDPKFGKSILITLYATTAQFISLFLALVISILLNQKLRGSKLMNALFFMPYVCSTIATAIMWRWIFDTNYGVLNDIIVKFFGESARVQWLQNPKTIIPVVITITVWNAVGYGIVMYNAAITAINPSLYEAASIDGASKLKQFTKITLPSVSRTTFFLLMAGIVNGLQTFDVVNVMAPTTDANIAGPNDAGLTMVKYIYYTATEGRNMPVAAVMSWVLFLITMVVMITNFRLSKRWVNDD